MITKLEEVLAEERRAHGITIVLVEQNVGFALALADRYAVLKVGTVVETGRAADAGARQTIERHLVI
jgi:branched-chain amino acid transport system ATP-binding protein